MMRKKLAILVLLIAVLFSSLPASSVAGEGSLPILVGMYPSAEIYMTVNEINTLQTYFGKPTVSIAGTFLDLESPYWLIVAELNTSWDNGYVPFINLGAGTAGTAWTAKQIADGALDAKIRTWARTYRGWVGDSERRAFIAPLQEMNGYWVTYKYDAPNFIRAYLRIRQIFKEEKVPEDSVSWTFAPNGWSEPGQEFENYYPGNSAVDVVGFSSFNFGNCWSYTTSDPYEKIYKPYFDRMAAMAPGKPIIVAEIGSVPDGVDRTVWFNDTLSKIGAYPGVRAIIYFNRVEDVGNYPPPPNPQPNCDQVDYRLDANGGEGKAAFKSKVTNAPYGYWASESVEMKEIAFARPGATFEDVWPASTFSGKSTTIYYQPWVERLVDARITGGCGASTVDFIGVTDFTYRYYCGESTVTRGQMAVFLQKGFNGPDFSPPPATGARFSDVPTNYWAAAWIEQLAADGITGGCGTNLYCPEQPVTRAQMAVFLLKSKHGTSYNPPDLDSGTGFSDVADTHWAAKWIKQLAAEGITGGCGAGIYCPEQPVTRGQMAIFLVRTFELP
jgi:hypothetical protein